jgi:hypothetical protein
VKAINNNREGTAIASSGPFSAKAKTLFFLPEYTPCRKEKEIVYIEGLSGYGQYTLF